MDNTPLSPVVESEKETSKVFETSENLAKSETTENLDNFSDDSLDVIVESEFPTEQVVQLTAVEMYQNFVAGYVLEPTSTPKQISKNKKFATAFSVKCTKDGNPVPNMLISVKYPAAQTNDFPEKPQQQSCLPDRRFLRNRWCEDQEEYEEA